MQIIKRELKGGPKLLLTPVYRKKPFQRKSNTHSILDIAAISAVGMHYYLRDADSKMFTTSLYEIDCCLQEKAKAKKQSPEPTLPAQYADY